MLAMGAFPVLMIHDHNFFRKAFWNEIIKVHELYDNTRLILVILLVVVITYMVGTVIELVRVQVFNILIFNRKIPNLYFSKLENLLKIDEDY